MTTDNRRAQRLLEELEARRQTRATLKREADQRGDHLLATVHSVAEDAYFDAFRMVAAALPTIVAEVMEEPVVGTPVMDLRLEEWTPGELSEVYGR